MTSVWGESASKRPPRGASQSKRRALGAGERRQWSSLVRQEDIGVIYAQLEDPLLRGVVIIGPRGVGKTTIANDVARRLGAKAHVMRLFGPGAGTEVPYSLFPVQMARLNSRQSESPAAVFGALVEQILRDAHGRPVVVVLEEIPGIDTLSMGILMHLVLGGEARLLVVARAMTDLPEDLAWMVKDGLLAQKRLRLLSRTEVRSLLVTFLNGPVAESVVATLYTASAGNQLVLQALVHEYLQSGTLRTQDGIWVQAGRLEKYSDDVLVELVESWLAREPTRLRKSIEKFSLLRNVSLELAIKVMGADEVNTLESLGFLTIATNSRKSVTFAEPYIGETVRNQLSTAQKAAYFKELSETLAMDAVVLSPLELLVFASWMNEAGLALTPAQALAAAQAALRLFDPQLALACLNHIPADHPLAVDAAQNRSRAYYNMANYTQAAEALGHISPQVLDKLSAPDYASWALDLTVALVWLPDGMHRIVQVLDSTAVRIQQATGPERRIAEQLHNLARFEVHVHRGEFAHILHDLQNASMDAGDRSYRLNCASLLTVALAAMGKAADAIDLSLAIEAEATQYDLVLRMGDWHLYGRVLALIWSGQWRQCEAVLKPAIELPVEALRYKGGALDMALGVAYAFAGRYLQAADILLVAAAQLEIRNPYTGLKLAYSALAFVFARLDDKAQSLRYLELTDEVDPCMVWINASLAGYFRAMALEALGDPDAVDLLVSTAKKDVDEGRVTVATVGLLSAVVVGAPHLHGFLELAAENCQGELAKIAGLLAQAAASGQAGQALEASDKARRLELADIERHSDEFALELAKVADDAPTLQTVRRRLRGLESGAAHPADQGLVPLTPREIQVARLAIKGMGNRDIATQIGVSVRTVEGHLYQVFAKLAISSRSELEKRVHL